MDDGAYCIYLQDSLGHISRPMCWLSVLHVVLFMHGIVDTSGIIWGWAKTSKPHNEASGIEQVPTAGRKQKDWVEHEIPIPVDAEKFPKWEGQGYNIGDLLNMPSFWAGWPRPHWAHLLPGILSVAEARKSSVIGMYYNDSIAPNTVCKHRVPYRTRLTTVLQMWAAKPNREV